MAVVAAWIVDTRAHRDGVLPNVAVADQRIRGLDAAELTAVVTRIADRFASATIDVRTPGGRFSASVPELGVAVNRDRTVDDVLTAGREGFWPRRLWVWARSFISPVKVPAAIDVDRQKLDRIVAERDPARTPPVEPSLTVRDGHLEGMAGQPGRGVNPAELAEALRRATPSAGTLEVSMQLSSIDPRFSKADADRLAQEAERLAGGGLQVAIGDQTAAVPASTLNRWLRAVPGETGLSLGIRPDAEVIADLAELLPDAGVKPVDAGFVVSGGTVSVTPSKDGTACCADDAHDILAAALVDPTKRASPVQLPLKTVSPQRDEEAARKLGIVEQIGTFTTAHPSGEPRVRNIHLMADTVRGAVIAPGETFSINGTVGRRTKENGYV
ncbi:MAG: peptidoglycan binding domain-containing protein, partial [Actinobacteria bacterium]|nr:peptidoglycan binding domain-containing protein [Actinomycetota bacterium]